MSPSLSKTNMSQNGEAASFSAGEPPVLRGVYAHRRGEVAADERCVAEFWRGRGFTVEAAEDAGERFSGKPDLLLSKDGAEWAWCEVKTVWQHHWTVRILDEEDRVMEERVEESSRPASERISADLVTALRQLKSGNPDHVLLNIVVFVNRDPEASFTLLTQMLARHELGSSARTLLARRAAMLAREIQEFRNCVDLCLWAVEQADGRLAVEGCLLFTTALREQLEALPGLDSAKQIILEPAA